MSDDITLPAMSKSEAWELTDEIRQGYEAIHENRVAQAERLANAYGSRAWEPMGYDSFDEYHSEEFGDELRHQRLELEERIGAVKVLADSGMAKTKIAEILGIGRATVYRDLAETSSGVSPDTSSEVDAPGQSVEEVGHIDDDEPQSPFVATHQPIVINFDPKVEEPNDDYEARVADRFAGINFDAMVIPVPAPQIIETNASQDTSDYFVPRVTAPSWSPPQITELPPPPVRAYDDRSDDTPEFLEPPMKLQKVGEANKTLEDKHCKTCACNLLP